MQRRILLLALVFIAIPLAGVIGLNSDQGGRITTESLEEGWYESGMQTNYYQSVDSSFIQSEEEGEVFLLKNGKTYI